jgi:hypothetical protein
MTRIRRIHTDLRQLPFLILVLVLQPFSAGQVPSQPGSTPQSALTDDVKSALNRISADSLRGHLSFIASDLLEGRNTPSRGLDIAAEYIAAQFRRAGLEPAGDDGYFQTANWIVSEKNLAGFEFAVISGDSTINIGRSGQFNSASKQALNLSKVPLIKLAYDDQQRLAALKPDEIAGKVVITEFPDLRRPQGRRDAAPEQAEVIKAMNSFLAAAAKMKAALVLSIIRRPVFSPQTRLVEPNLTDILFEEPLPYIAVYSPDLAKLYDSMTPGPCTAPCPAALTVRLLPASEKQVKVRNVIGLLRGSDPALKETYVLITAHYDHLGMKPSGEGDRIFNGANDDGSGTVSVMELASAFATMTPRPKRSLVFMTFFGEEKGLVGSRFYGRHPVFPIDRTVADINLEQVGRTDSSQGPQVSTASVTGFDYSDVGTILKEAGTAMDVKVYKHERNSDAYFGASDNQALADQGVPAHTLCVAYAYPDYHGVGDHWEKIDYKNMEKIDRMVGLAVVLIATNPEPPKWNQNNPKAARYLEAWKQLHPSQ